MILGSKHSNHVSKCKMNKKIKFIRRKKTMSIQTNQLKVVPVAGRIGAEIQGVQLSKDLDTSVLNEIKKALDTYKVVFFKGQNHLDDASQEVFAKFLGELYAHPTVPVKENSSSILE